MSLVRPARTSSRQLERQKLAAWHRLHWDQRVNNGDGREALEPLSHEQPRDAEILAALWRHHYLSTRLVNRIWWPSCSLQATRRRLGQLWRAGLTERFRPYTDSGGADWVYVLTRAGFDVARGRGTLERTADFVARQPSDFAYVRHDLDVVEWGLDFRDAAQAALLEWIGADEARVDAPRGGRGELAKIPAESGRQVDGLALEQAATVDPDCELQLESHKRPVGFARYLIELDRTGRPGYQLDKWRRYDALICSWWRRSARLSGDGAPPIVVFVCADQSAQDEFLRAADQVMTGANTQPGRPARDWSYPGRDQLLLCTRNQLGDGDRSYLRLPALPPRVRGGAEATRRSGQFPTRAAK